MTVQDNDSWYTSIIRTFTTQNRVKTIVFVQNVIDRAFEIASIYTRDQDSQKNKTGWFIIEDIKKSTSGLHNILNTYKDDRMFVCKMESLLQKINVKLEKFENPIEFTKSQHVVINHSSPIFISRNTPVTPTQLSQTLPSSTPASQTLPSSISASQTLPSSSLSNENNLSAIHSL